MIKNDANGQRMGGFWAYFWQVLHQIGRDVKGNTLPTVLAVVSIVVVAAFQIRYLAAPAGLSRESALTAILRSIALFLAYLLFHFVRAPWQLYRRREAELQERITTIETEHQGTLQQLTATLEEEHWSRDADRLNYERERQRLRELLGQPDLMLECVPNQEGNTTNKGDLLLTLRNAGRPLVSNITSLQVNVPMSDQIIHGHQEMRDAFPAGDISPSAQPGPDTWTIQFGPIKDLAGGDSTSIIYEISNIGALQRRSLAFVLSNCQHPGPNWREGFVVAIPITIECLSNGSRWRLKYDLCYSLMRKQAWVQSREFMKIEG